MNMSLIIMEDYFGSIDADDYTFHCYYIIILSSSPYTLQDDLSIDRQVIYYGELVCDGTFFQSISILIIMFLQK